MRTPDGYALTAEASVRAVERVLAGGVPAGALTPSQAFGADFIKDLSGVEVFDGTGERLA
jgi:saccharopine dehydrogenase (NAD+, L-lysine-forming)